MSEKRLVDYVFLAGLPEDFDITLKETNLETPHNKPASSKSNDTISETQSNQNESNNTHTTTSDDEESLRIADATLIESVRASIAKFDNERDEFLKSLRGARSSTSRNGSNESGKQRSSILPSASLFRNGSILSSKILKGLDERVSETDSLASSSRNTTNNHNTSSQPEQPLISHQTYLNVAPQASPSKSQVQEACEHPLKQKFSPRLLARYPQIDYSKEEKFPAYIPMFCFPNDIVILESESAPPATYHGFVMTQEDGSKRYGVCLTTFEPLPNHLISQVEILHKKWCAENINSSNVEYANHLAEKIRDEKQRAKAARKKLEAQVAIINSDEREKIDREIADAEEKLSLYNDLLQPIKSAIIETNKLWLPRCIGITSHLPWHDILRDWLCAVTMPMIEGLKGNKQTEDYLPLERYIVNLIHEIPLPPPGKLQIAISINDTTLFCGRPALNQTPIMRDFSLYPLFRSLSFKSILTLLEVVLAEGKILLISSYPDMLYLVAHSITYVMYPFSWQGVFIPILPARLMTCLQAPVPYIMGIQRQYKGTDLLPEDACIVDLDKDTIMIAQPPPQLPPRQRKKLLQSLEAYAPMHSHYSIPYGAPLYVQQAYPHGRFTPHCAKSKIIDNNKRITGVVAMPARAVPLAPSMNSFYDIDSPSSPVAFEPITRTTSLPGVEFRLHQRRMSNFSGSSSLFGSRDGSLKSEKTTSASSISDKSVKKKTNRFSTLSGAKSSIMSLRNKALNRTSLLALNQMNSGHAHKLSGDIISLPQPSNASQHDTASLFDDGWSVMVDPSERIPTEKDFVPREGHLMAEIPAEGNPDGQPGMKTWVLESLACGICQKSLGLNKVYKCEGCSMVAHDECLADITYPCTPACFDETKVHDAFLRVFASMLRNYRAYLTDGSINSGGQNSHEGSAFAINDEFFKKEQFLKSVERESKPFLSQLLDSQAFSYFVHERLTHPADPQILYFDEIITAKLNRSKLRISKEATLFLDDSSYAISQTLRATKPDDNGLSGACYRRTRLPSSFDLDLISSPRPLQSLNAYL